MKTSSPFMTPTRIPFARLLLFFAMSFLFLVDAQAIKSYDCLTTPNGVPRKIIVKEKKVVAFQYQNLSGYTTSLKFFRKYFIFKESEQGYLIGEATFERSIIGWVQKKDVLPWNTAQAIFFINKQASGRIPVRVWMSRNDVGNTKNPTL